LSPEDISEHFGESPHCKNLKFENSDESRTHLGELKGSLTSESQKSGHDLHWTKNKIGIMFKHNFYGFFIHSLFNLLLLLWGTVTVEHNLIKKRYNITDVI
jgi:hypothetical protein